HRADTQSFGQSRDRAHDPLGRVELAIKGRAVRFEKIGITDHAVELPPGPTPRMAVRADIAPSDPAIIRACFVRTVLVMGVYSSGASALGSDHGRRGKRGPINVMLVLLTRIAVRLVGQAGKGLGDL